jgi:hypothetical protein
MEDKTEMRIAAVAVLDALGFKGIWNSYDPAEVAGALDGQRRMLASFQGLSRSRPPEIRFLAVSDTLIIASLSPFPWSENLDAYHRQVAGVLAHDVQGMARMVLQNAHHKSPMLLFRGCVAVGPMYSESDQLIGGAIDEAAEAMNYADGAFVWLLPSASRFRLPPENDALEPELIDYRVPMHGGRRLLVPTVNPLAACSNADHRRKIADAMLGAFSDERRLRGKAPTLEVLAKLQNTRDFLEQAERETAAHMATLSGGAEPAS